MPVDQSVFKAYDVRGTYPDQMNEERRLQDWASDHCLSRRGDRASRVSELTIAVGRDMRLSAPDDGGEYIDGLTDGGARRARHRPGRHRGSLLDRQPPRTRRRRDGHGQSQPGRPTPEPSSCARRRCRSPATRASARSATWSLPTTSASRRRRAASVAEEDVMAEFQLHALGFINPEAVKPIKVVADGGNGMAGPMVGPVLDELPVVDLKTFYWTPDGTLPGPRAEPAAPGEPRVHHREGQDRGRAAGHRLGRRRRPLLLHRRARPIRRRRLPDRAARGVAAEEVPRRDDSLRRARIARRRRHRRSPPAAARWSTASVTPSSRLACTRTARSSAARSAVTTTSATSAASTAARCRRC